MDSSFPPLSGWSEIPSQSDMSTQPISSGSDVTIGGQQVSPRSKRKKPSSDTELEPTHPGAQLPPVPLSYNSGTAARVIPAARASGMSRQLQRRRQRRQSHSNEGFLPGTSEGVAHSSSPANGESRSSTAGQHAPAPAQSYPTLPAVGQRAPPNSTCYYCHGPGYMVKEVQVPLAALNHGGFPLPSARASVSSLSGDFVTSRQQEAYSLQPTMQPTAWQPADTTSAQFHIPRLPVGLAGNDQADDAAAWLVDPFDGSDSVSYSGSFPGFSEHAVSFPPVPGALSSVLDHHAQGMRAYGCHPVAEESVPVPWPFDGELTRAGDDSLGTVTPSGWPDMRYTSED